MEYSNIFKFLSVALIGQVGVAAQPTALYPRDGITGPCNPMPTVSGQLVVACVTFIGLPEMGYSITNPVYTAGATQSDYTDASGSLPNGSTFSESVAVADGVTTTVTVTKTFSAGFNVQGINAGVQSSVSNSVAVANTTTQTETVTVPINCPSGSGNVQYQPVYLRIDGTFNNCTFKDGGCDVQSSQQGTVWIPQVGENNQQIVNYRVLDSSGASNCA